MSFALLETNMKVRLDSLSGTWRYETRSGGTESIGWTLWGDLVCGFIMAWNLGKLDMLVSTLFAGYGNKEGRYQAPAPLEN